MNIVIAILVFGVVVLVHELGHFFAARACGVLVEEFSIGMGPRLFTVTRGDTDYSLRLFPIGGSCQMLGEDTDNQHDQAFGSKPIWKRAIILSAGVFMNFLLAFLAFLAVTAGTPYPLRVPVVHSLMPGYPAEAAGIQPGDRITNINGHGIHIYSDYMLAIDGNLDKPIDIQIMRGDVKHNFVVTPTFDAEGERYLIGFVWDARHSLLAAHDGSGEILTRASVWETMEIAYYNVFFSIKSTAHGLGRLLTFQANPNEFAGPIAIVAMVGDIQTESLEAGGIPLAVLNMVSFMALLSANLGVFNLLPVPALDGGRLVFLGIEGIRRKPIAPEKEGVVHLIGFVLLMVLAVFIAYNDILKLL